MKILCLVDWKVKDRWLWGHLPGNQDTIDFLYTTTTDRFPKWGKLLTSYPRYVQLAWKAYQKAKGKDYDLIVAWESDTGFPLGLLRNLLQQKSPRLVVLTFSMRGPTAHFRWLGRAGVGGMDFFTVPTEHEQQYYAQMLKIPLERIYVLTIGAYDAFGAARAFPSEPILFSGGRSGRDYRTFFEAVVDLPIPVVVNARRFNLKNLTIPANVQCNEILPLTQFCNLNIQAQAVVVPLVKADEALGLTSIVYAMGAGRPVIVTDLPGTKEYVVEGETGLLVPEGDAQAMREAICYLWERPELCRQMGMRAREIFEERYTFEKFAERTDMLLHKIQSKL